MTRRSPRPPANLAGTTFGRDILTDWDATEAGRKFGGWRSFVRGGFDKLDRDGGLIAYLRERTGADGNTCEGSADPGDLTIHRTERLMSVGRHPTPNEKGPPGRDGDGRPEKGGRRGRSGADRADGTDPLPPIPYSVLVLALGAGLCGLAAGAAVGYVSGLMHRPPAGPGPHELSVELREELEPAFQRFVRAAPEERGGWPRGRLPVPGGGTVPIVEIKGAFGADYFLIPLAEVDGPEVWGWSQAGERWVIRDYKPGFALAVLHPMLAGRLLDDPPGAADPPPTSEVRGERGTTGHVGAPFRGMPRLGGRDVLPRNTRTGAGAERPAAARRAAAVGAGAAVDSRPRRPAGPLPAPGRPADGTGNGPRLGGYHRPLRSR